MCSTRDAPVDLLEQARHERDAHAELLAAADEPQQHLVRRRREGDDHLLDVVVGDHLLEVPARAEHRHRDRAVERVQRLLVEEPDRLEPQLRVREQPLRDQPADAARRPRSASAASPRPAGAPATATSAARSGRPRGTRSRTPTAGSSARPARPARRTSSRSGQHAHRGERRGSDDSAEVLEQLRAGCAALYIPAQREAGPARARRRRRGSRPAARRRRPPRSRSPPRSRRPTSMLTSTSGRASCHETSGRRALDPLDGRVARRHGLEGLVGRSRVDRMDYAATPA